MPITKASSSAVAPGAKGELVVGNATNDSGILSVGANGTVLTADSTTATGVKWATPAAGGMTLISEQVLSASTGYSFSSIPGTYKQLLLVWSGIKHSATGSDFTIRFNANSGSVYECTGIYFNSSSGGPFADPRTDISASNQASFGQSATCPNGDFQAVQGILLLDNYASSTKEKHFSTSYGYRDVNNSEARAAFIEGNFASTTAVTSIDITRLTGSATISNVTNTTVRLYGVS